MKTLKASLGCIALLFVLVAATPADDDPWYRGIFGIDGIWDCCRNAGTPEGFCCRNCCWFIADCDLDEDCREN